MNADDKKSTAIIEDKKSDPVKGNSALNKNNENIIQNLHQSIPYPPSQIEKCDALWKQYSDSTRDEQILDRIVLAKTKLLSINAMEKGNIKKLMDQFHSFHICIMSTLATVENFLDNFYDAGKLNIKHMEAENLFKDLYELAKNSDFEAFSKKYTECEKCVKTIVEFTNLLSGKRPILQEFLNISSENLGKSAKKDLVKIIESIIADDESSDLFEFSKKSTKKSIPLDNVELEKGNTKFSKTPLLRKRLYFLYHIFIHFYCESSLIHKK